MKNVHILPTDKPSFGKYLVINKQGKLCIWSTDTMGSQITLNPQHIYITSDEEIKEGDYYIAECGSMDRPVHKHIGKEPKGDYFKIILTTNQLLDGVQAIDDEFLEWFVKNPSCEEVEVERFHGINTSIAEINAISGDGSLNWQGRGDFRDYKIIIPKEEPKQETLEQIVSKQFQKEFNKEVGKVLVQELKKKEMKQTAVEWLQEEIEIRYGITPTSILLFRDAKEMEKQQQGYSEEEVFELCNQFATFIQQKRPSYKKQLEWFEQFKKK